MPTWRDLYDKDYDIEADYQDEVFFEGIAYPDKERKNSKGIIDGNFIAPDKKDKSELTLSENIRAEYKNSQYVASGVEKANKDIKELNFKSSTGKNNDNMLFESKKFNKRNNEI
jgi:hypothetical protein